uniref:Uncharacterized protein n=1 Tax=Chromera velia CCMP2878 TaxID=1169474 RepID=A0A0G4HWG3_9ALVE|eukprot:Cvel_9009.t1-p1 / transcript=Cvel_9009.t1 / gene=Cvel_9009 / organism=Chromera_velia_CCMP2878 / gene_product=hypothetical protein / transcript_product=hypothetical protein / location=Cvel_scaffold510:5849-6280(-) / protein_length=144 / sequence_SO=supercontig / SO=protein_coding / is_pseudo=false
MFRAALFFALAVASVLSKRVDVKPVSFLSEHGKNRIYNAEGESGFCCYTYSKESSDTNAVDCTVKGGTENGIKYPRQTIKAAAHFVAAADDVADCYSAFQYPRKYGWTIEPDYHRFVTGADDCTSANVCQGLVSKLIGTSIPPL